MMIWIFLMVLIVSVKFGAAQIDWCSNKFDCIVDGKTHKHTMCDDGGGGPQDFVNITYVSTDETRKSLLRVQNAFRNNTAAGQAEWPKGANIRQVTWDYTLQSLAVHWALKCRPENDVCRKTPDYDVVGQLVGAGTYKEEDKDPSLEILSGWIKRQHEISSGSIKDTINSFVHGDWDPATNIMWAETVKMGCGEVLCIKDKTPTSQKNFRVLVCNYAPGGNIPSKPIYNIGDPCSAGCPAGTVCKTKSLYTQLCALPGDPTDDSLPPPPPDPFKPTAPPSIATVKMSWKLHVLLCSALLSKLA